MTGSASVLDFPRKRSLSTEDVEEKEFTKRPCQENNKLLKELTDILAEIKSMPSSGEISAELLSSLRTLMLQIETLSADETNVEARNMKDESDRCLDLWLQELVALCETDEEEEQEEGSVEFNVESENEDEEEDIALALALQDEEDYCKEIEKEEVCSKQEEDNEEDVEVDIL